MLETAHFQFDTKPYLSRVVKLIIIGAWLWSGGACTVEADTTQTLSTGAPPPHMTGSVPAQVEFESQIEQEQQRNTPPSVDVNCSAVADQEFDAEYATLPATLAAARRDTAALRTLTASDLDELDEHLGLTGTAAWVRSGCIEGVAAVIELGADLNRGGVEDMTPLHVAVEPGIIALLVDSGANPAAVDLYGLGPMAYYVFRQDLLAMEALLDVSSKPPPLGRALDAAISEGCIECVYLLVESGALDDAMPAYWNGSTAVEIASERGQFDIALYLRDFE